MIYTVLIEPEKPGNIGAIARAMKNFDLENIVLVNPQCDHLSSDAMNRAKYAKDILKKAKIFSFYELKKQFHTLIATTSKLGTDYNIPRSPINPEQLASIIPKRKKIAILFGREGIGLKNNEIAACDFTVTIPTSPKYPAMNLSHSAAIVFYEIFKNSKKEKISSHIKLASKAEKDQMLKMINQILDKLPFATKEKKETQRIVWKKMLTRSFLSKRESFAVMGFFRKLLR